MNTSHAIPTIYQGYAFRSRLEARWAVFFDALAFRWEYEPEGYVLPDGTRYLPDFWLPQVSMFAEVKPACLGDDIVEIGEDAMLKVIGLVETTGHPTIILDGVPRDTNYWAVWPDPILGWNWTDVYLSDENHYHLSEHRLYVDTGESERRHIQLEIYHAPGFLCPGVLAARSARFGERAVH
jgi:hypothetical protein